MLLEHSGNHFCVDSDSCDGEPPSTKFPVRSSHDHIVIQAVHGHDSSRPWDTYNLDTYFSPITPADTACTTLDLIQDFYIHPSTESETEESATTHTQISKHARSMLLMHQGCEFRSR